MTVPSMSFTLRFEVGLSVAPQFYSYLCVEMENESQPVLFLLCIELT